MAMRRSDFPFSLFRILILVLFLTGSFFSYGEKAWGDEILVTQGVAKASVGPMTVHAGLNQLIALGVAVELDGTINGESDPPDPGIKFVWEKVSGPGPVNFTNPNSEDTTATFPVLGSYTLRFTAQKDNLSVSDDVVIDVVENFSVRGLGGNVRVGETIEVPILISRISEPGFVGYQLEATLSESDAAEIVTVVMPPELALSRFEIEEGKRATFMAVDLGGFYLLVGRTDLNLATLHIKGVKEGSVHVRLSLGSIGIDDSMGNPVLPQILTTTIHVFVSTPPSNTPPVALRQSVETLEGVSEIITLLATDDDGDDLFYRIERFPLNGILTGNPPELTYTPNPGFTGTDDFLTIARDGLEDSNEATVSINVMPSEGSPSIDPIPDQSVRVGNLLSIVVSASDPEGDLLSFEVMDKPETASFVMPGDVNLDGAVNVFDVTIMLRAIVGKVVLSAIQREVADLNGDSAVNVFDAQMILATIVGKGPELNRRYFVWTPASDDIGEHRVTFRVKEREKGEAGLVFEREVKITVETAGLAGTTQIQTPSELLEPEAPSPAEQNVSDTGVEEKSLTITVDEKGGTIGDLENFKAQVILPPGAVTGASSVELSRVDLKSGAAFGAMKKSAQQLILSGVNIELKAWDVEREEEILRFEKPVQIMMRYEASIVKDPVTLGIFYWDEKRHVWQAIPGSRVDTNLQAVVVEVNHLSQFAVFVVPSLSSSDFGEVFVYPNPVVGSTAKFHVEIGQVERLSLRIYDLEGSLIHETVLPGAPGVGINGKQAYEYIWDSTGAASGTYLYVVQATKNKKTIQTLKKFAIVQ